MHVEAAPRNKIDFYRRYSTGEFGNRPRTWETWQALCDSDYTGRVTIRSLEPGGLCFYGVDVVDLRAGRLPAGCVDLKERRFSEAMPDEDLTIQGNVWHDGFLQLEYSCEPGIGHRDAVKLPRMKCAHGLLAISLLRSNMDPSSYDDLQEMLDTYPGAVIEFSAYDRNVGIIPGRRVIFWEVPLY